MANISAYDKIVTT